MSIILQISSIQIFEFKIGFNTEIKCSFKEI